MKTLLLDKRKLFLAVLLLILCPLSLKSKDQPNNISDNEGVAAGKDLEELETDDESDDDHCDDNECTIIDNACPKGEEDDHWDDDDGNEDQECDLTHKSWICHVPPGNPANTHTICVDKKAIPAHLNHGDSRGACSIPQQPEPVCDAAKDLVINGSFESPVSATNWSLVPSGNAGLGWTVVWRKSPSSYQGKKRPEKALLEIQHGVNGWISFDGVQHAELDTDWDGPGGDLNGEPASVNIYQDLPTVPGREYMIHFASSPRPGTAASNNALEFSWNDQIRDTLSKAGSSNTSWKKNEYFFKATGTTTRIQFGDAGVPSDSFGTLLDAVSVHSVCNIGGTTTGGTTTSGTTTAGTTTDGTTTSGTTTVGTTTDGTTTSGTTTVGTTTDGTTTSGTTTVGTTTGGTTTSGTTTVGTTTDGTTTSGTTTAGTTTDGTTTSGTTTVGTTTDGTTTSGTTTVGTTTDGTTTSGTTTAGTTTDGTTTSGTTTAGTTTDGTTTAGTTTVDLTPAVSPPGDGGTATSGGGDTDFLPEAPVTPEGEQPQTAPQSSASTPDMWMVAGNGCTLMTTSPVGQHHKGIALVFLPFLGLIYLRRKTSSR